MVAREPTEATRVSTVPQDSDDDIESVSSVASSDSVPDAKVRPPVAGKRAVSDKQLEHLKKIRELANVRRAEKYAKAREAKEADAARKAAIAARERALADQKAAQEAKYLKKLDKKLAKPATAKADKPKKRPSHGLVDIAAPAAAVPEKAAPSVASVDSTLTAKIAELERQVLKLKYKSKYAKAASAAAPVANVFTKAAAQEPSHAPAFDHPMFNPFGRI